MIVSCVGVSLGYNLCAGLLRAVGDSLTALYFLIFSALVNIILDFFITQLHLGVQSAGLATIISQGLSAIIKPLSGPFWTRNGHGPHEFHCFYWNCDLTVRH